MRLKCFDEACRLRSWKTDALLITMGRIVLWESLNAINHLLVRHAEITPQPRHQSKDQKSLVAETEIHKRSLVLLRHWSLVVRSHVRAPEFVCDPREVKFVQGELCSFGLFTSIMSTERAIDLVTVFDAMLTSRQTREKLQCLYENLMSNNFRRAAVLQKI